MDDQHLCEDTHDEVLAAMHYNGESYSSLMIRMEDEKYFQQLKF